MLRFDIANEGKGSITSDLSFINTVASVHIDALSYLFHRAPGFPVTPARSVWTPKNIWCIVGYSVHTQISVMSVVGASV